MGYRGGDEDEFVGDVDDPALRNDPRRLLDECWRAEDRLRGAPYGERYVGFIDLVALLSGLEREAWLTFSDLYQREKRRRRPTTGSDMHDWFSLAQARRG